MFLQRAKISKSKLNVEQPSYNNAMKHMKDGDYLLLLVSLNNDRNVREWQRLYRVILKQMSLDTGNDTTEMHEMCKDQVLSQMELGSTTELDPISWAEYFERLRVWAHENFDFIF